MYTVKKVSLNKLRKKNVWNIMSYQCHSSMGELSGFSHKGET